MLLCEIIQSLREYSNRGELYKYLNQIADELEKRDWVPIEKQEKPTKPGYYNVTLQDGNVYRVCLDGFANGYFWMFSRNFKIDYELRTGQEPEVIAWLPNPEPYVRKGV